MNAYKYKPTHPIILYKIASIYDLTLKDEEKASQYFESFLKEVQEKIINGNKETELKQFYQQAKSTKNKIIHHLSVSVSAISSCNIIYLLSTHCFRHTSHLAEGFGKPRLMQWGILSLIFISDRFSFLAFREWVDFSSKSFYRFPF